MDIKVRWICGSAAKSPKLVELGGKSVEGIIGTYPSSPRKQKNIKPFGLPGKINMEMKNIQEVYHRYPILEEKKRLKAGSLSGGEKQILALARTSLIKPKLILLDEPSLGLAPKVIDQIYQEIDLMNRQGVTFLIVEQNARKALRLAHRAYVLDLGVNRLEDTGEGLLQNEEVKRLYLGG